MILKVFFCGIYNIYDDRLANSGYRNRNMHRALLLIVAVDIGYQCKLW